MNPARYLLLPWWMMQLATGAKAFSGNPVLGSRRLNGLGLHVVRILVAARLARWRRARLRHLIDEQDAAAFDRDGFVLKRQFLSDSAFAALRAQVLGYTGPAREMRQGDTVTRRLAIDPAARRALPAVRTLLTDARWRGLLRYVGSFDAEPDLYIQTILSQVADDALDPQTELHADTFHPTVKAWLFLTDVAADEGPFVFVPGSHRMTVARLAWEQARSVRARDLDRLSARGSLRIAPEELAGLGLPAPRAFAVPANTLIIADTSGFHARGHAARPSKRIEIWAYGRRNPFLPWTGLDWMGALPIGPRRVPAMWAVRDRFARWLGQPWRAVGPKTAVEPSEPA